MHARALPNVIACIMHDITCTRALLNVITCRRALPNVITCIMHDLTCTRSLPNVITCTRALSNVTTCIMHDIACTRALLNVIICKKASQVYLGMRKSTQTCAVVLLYSRCFDGG